ncbi:SPOR domain-containing protein [Halioxenophilus aromaticivorans]|uniref:SPOR domain-containing protein n=1 Tax=Halioxenophilus aromaticivorans TaxID=1306992 RepID=A0AAV3U2M5_9ALTE
MSRDFAKKKPANTPKRRNRRPNQRKAKSSVPVWLWLATGILVGAFVMFLLHLNGLTPSQQPKIVVSETTVMEAQPPANDETEQEQPSATRLQFYRLLKESTVEVPEPDPATAANEPANTTLYVLQAGSFKNSSDANRMRAELILLNLNANVEESLGSDNQQVWYRVMVGPFESRSRMAKARSILVSNDINPLLLKRAKEAG